MKVFLISAMMMLSPLFAQADTTNAKAFGDTTVYFSAFNSSFIKPEVASAYNITRGVDKGLVNIAVVEKGSSTGRTAVVEGSVSNIFAQQQTLDFFEVREGDAVYYLAPFEFEHEDPLTFKVQVRNNAGDKPYNVTFQRTFYHDNK
ncbi:MAG: hypothetical protein CMK32_15035 [Porticoccaceae bacterium]|nr:hypothetical protein [Porticoccaceae bacterium]